MPIPSHLFQGPPTTAQFAKGGAWETAWCFDADSPPADAAVIGYLDHCTELAFEAFFGAAFFGVRLVGTPAQVQAFAFAALRTLHGARKGGGGGDEGEGSFFAQMRQRFQLPVAGAAPAFTELGCVNAWQSIGTVRFDDPQAAAAAFDATWRQVEASPLSRDTQRVKALEYAFEAPLAHWFGVPVSGLEAPFRLSPSALQEALERPRLP